MAGMYGLKVLLVGHPCSPGVGSEPGLTWNWAWHLSRHHQIWAMVHPRYRGAIETFLAAHPNPHLHFVWVDLPRWRDPWHPARGERGIRLHYLFWQHAVRRQALSLQEQHAFDLIHHVSWGTIGAPPPLSQLGVPLVWGPVGGGQTAPSAFRKYLGSGWWQERLRSLRVALLPWYPPLCRVVRQSALMLATNSETDHVLRKAGAPDVQLFLDSGLPAAYVTNGPPRRSNRQGLTLLWAGRLEARKALPLALEALSQVGEATVNLMVAGDGPRRREWEGWADRLGCGRQVRFLGFWPWEKMGQLFQEADAFLFTSLRDSFGSVLLEAMAHALPILTLDHQGAGAFVPREAAIKVAVTTPTETIAGLAQGIHQLMSCPNARYKMGEAAWVYAKTQTWEHRAVQMNQWYGACLQQ